MPEVRAEAYGSGADLNRSFPWTIFLDMSRIARFG